MINFNVASYSTSGYFLSKTTTLLAIAIVFINFHSLCLLLWPIDYWCAPPKNFTLNHQDDPTMMTIKQIALTNNHSDEYNKNVYWHQFVQANTDDIDTVARARVMQFYYDDIGRCFEYKMTSGGPMNQSLSSSSRSGLHDTVTNNSRYLYHRDTTTTRPVNNTNEDLFIEMGQLEYCRNGWTFEVGNNLSLIEEFKLVCREDWLRSFLPFSMALGYLLATLWRIVLNKNCRNYHATDILIVGVDEVDPVDTSNVQNIDDWDLDDDDNPDDNNNNNLPEQEAITKTDESIKSFGYKRAMLADTLLLAGLFVILILLVVCARHNETYQMYLVKNFVRSMLICHIMLMLRPAGDNISDKLTLNREITKALPLVYSLIIVFWPLVAMRMIQTWSQLSCLLTWLVILATVMTFLYQLLLTIFTYELFQPVQTNYHSRSVGGKSAKCKIFVTIKSCEFCSNSMNNATTDNNIRRCAPAIIAMENIRRQDDTTNNSTRRTQRQQSLTEHNYLPFGSTTFKWLLNTVFAVVSMNYLIMHNLTNHNFTDEREVSGNNNNITFGVYAGIIMSSSWNPLKILYISTLLNGWPTEIGALVLQSSRNFGDRYFQLNWLMSVTKGCSLWLTVQFALIGIVRRENHLIELKWLYSLVILISRFVASLMAINFVSTIYRLDMRMENSLAWWPSTLMIVSFALLIASFVPVLERIDIVIVPMIFIVANIVAYSCAQALHRTFKRHLCPMLFKQNY